METVDYSCSDHSDCTVTVYTVDGAEVGRRHLHQWVEESGKWGRHPDNVVIGALNVGILVDYDPATGEVTFDPDATILTVSESHTPGDKTKDDPAERLNETFPWADDHRTGKKVTRPTRDKLPRAPK